MISVSTSWFKGLMQRFGGGARVDPAARERAERVKAFRTAVARDLERGDRTVLEALLRMPAEMGLPDEDVELEIESVQGAVDLLTLREAVASAGLPVVEHQHKALGADRCHFRASAFLANDGLDRTGRLFLTNRRLVFVSSPMIALSWSAVASIGQDARDLIVTPTKGDSVYQFRCNSFSDARCGAFIAQTLKRGNSATAADDPRVPR
jgi:hypothetical protein